MRFSISQALVGLLAVEAVSANWFGRTAYNKWHETELERWLSDNNVPYPSPADRKDLENLVKNNWNDKVVSPYNSWDTNQLQKYLSSRGEEVKKGTEKNKDSLIEQVKASWTDTGDRAGDAYGSVRDWIFDTWTESQLKSFCDYHGIPAPQPRTRDSLLKSTRENYQSIATKAGETAAYPGDWLFKSWSDSDLKSWLDERGIPVYQGTKRNELIAQVRRNSRTASNNLGAWSSSLSASAASATQTIADAVFDTWSDSQLKKWADEKGINIPQGSKRNEVIALARRQNAKLNAQASTIASSASSAYGAASSSAGNQYARASDDAGLKLDNLQSAFYSYVDWAKQQIGLAASTASASGYSASGQASKSASASASAASKSASSISKSASKSYESAKSSASKAAERVKEEL